MVLVLLCVCILAIMKSSERFLLPCHEFSDVNAWVLPDVLCILQPREVVSATGKSSDEIVLELAAELALKVPQPLDKKRAGENTFRVVDGMLDSLAVVLLQEMVRVWATPV